MRSKLGAAIVGSKATVRAGLEKLLGDTGADEVIIVTDTYEHADRLQSYERVAGTATMIEVNPTGCRSVRDRRIVACKNELSSRSSKQTRR